MGNVVDYGATVRDGTGDALHVAFAKLDAGARAFTIIDKDLTAPPGSPGIGDAYIVGASATGDWAGQDGNIAVFGLASTWLFVTAAEGMTAYVQDEDAEYRYDGSAWAGAAGGGNVSSADISTIEVVSQAEYDALSPPSSTTLYLIEEA